jgi:hypothetical protein
MGSGSARSIRRWPTRVSWATLLLACACSSAATKGKAAGAATGGEADAAVGGQAEAAAGGGEADAYRSLATDVVFTMGGHVDGGTEALICLLVSMPAGGTTAVARAESHYTIGSHHFLAQRTSLTSIPAGEDVSHPCGDTEMSNITGSYYEAQTPNAHRELPSGVAHLFKRGEIMLLTSHYLNSSSSAVDAHVEFRLHTMDPMAVVEEAGTFFFYNPTITIPPYATVTVTRTCPIPQDLNLALLWSHMHSRGVGFTASTDDATAATRVGVLYATTTWSEPEPKIFPADPPVTLHAGSSITYSCSYSNTTSQQFVAGVSAATNEMCILHGMYWPRLDSATENCTSGVTTTGQAFQTDNAPPTGQ